MYDPIFAKSFSRYHRQRFGFCALFLCFIVALTIFSSSNPPLHPLSLLGGAVNLQLSISAVEDMLIVDDKTDNVSDKSASNNAAQDMLTLDQANRITQFTLMPSQNPEPNIPQTETDKISADKSASDNDMLTLNQTNKITQFTLMPSRNPEPNTPQIETNKIEPPCRVLNANADYCEMEGDIRVDSTSSTVFLIRPHPAVSPSDITSWIIRPYPRRGVPHARNWTVTLAADGDENIPKCSKNHTLPALLFSIGGFSGNHFHDFTDLIIPLYTTSFQFKREVHLLASDYKPWWPAKFHGIIHRLTKHGLLDIDREKDVNCYAKMTAGLRFHNELVIDPSSEVSMKQFRQLIRETYSLDRTKAIKLKKGPRIKPRLMIISRKRTRITTNEAEVSRAARKLGYDVVLAEGDTAANLTKFAQLVNSCDVMMGVHGAGLTNMLFLPDSAVLIQVVPWGAIDGFAKLDFGNPAPGMNIRYLEYKIGMRESSLIQQYPADHPVIRDPLSFHRKGWGHMRAIYLDNQNVTIDIHRFKSTLAKALKLLRH